MKCVWLWENPSANANVFLPLRPKIFLCASAEHFNKDKAKDGNEEEKEKKKVTEREGEKEKKKHKMMNVIKKENKLKQLIKGWWETYIRTKLMMQYGPTLCEF